MASEIDPQGREPQVLLDAADFNRARVIEIGCGDGRLTFHYGRVSRFVVGLELKAAQLASAVDACPSQLGQRLKFIRASAMALPFGAGDFDIALFAKSL